MADNCAPELQNPLNYQSEEKPYYNSSEASDLIIQNNQPNSFPNQNYYTNNQIPNPGYNINNSSADEQSNCTNNMNNNIDNNNNIQNEPQVPENKLCLQIILAILLFIVIGVTSSPRRKRSVLESKVSSRWRISSSKAA